MEKFCANLKEHATKIKNIHKSYINHQKFDEELNGNKSYCKVWDHCHYTEKYMGVVDSICNLRYKTPK